MRIYHEWHTGFYYNSCRCRRWGAAVAVWLCKLFGEKWLNIKFEERLASHATWAAISNTFANLLKDTDQRSLGSPSVVQFLQELPKQESTYAFPSFLSVVGGIADHAPRRTHGLQSLLSTSARKTISMLTARLPPTQGREIRRRTTRARLETPSSDRTKAMPM